MPLGLVEMELELGGDKGQEKSWEMRSFSYHVKLCLLNPNIMKLEKQVSKCFVVNYPK